MSSTLVRVRALVDCGEVLISAHGYRELASDGILVDDVIAGLGNGVLIEDYPAYQKEACVLVLQRDSSGRAIYVVWGIPEGRPSPAVMVTAYRPDPKRWIDDVRRRK
ncbi:MAG TPA: DUF4258 domain-containing protein [Rhizomicrobium sp.]